MTPQERLAWLAEMGRARGLRLAASGAEREDLRAGALSLRAGGYLRDGTAPLPFQWVAAKAATGTDAPVGRLVDFMTRNSEALLSEARSIAGVHFGGPKGEGKGRGGDGRH